MRLVVVIDGSTVGVLGRGCKTLRANASLGVVRSTEIVVPTSVHFVRGKTESGQSVNGTLWYLVRGTKSFALRAFIPSVINYLT